VLKEHPIYTFHPSIHKRSISLQEVLEYCTFVEPAEKCRRALPYAEIPQAAVDMQRIEVMFNGCCQSEHSFPQ